MEKIRIITDSGSDLTAPHPANLTVLPLTIHFGDEEYLDGVTINHKQFFEKLAVSRELPKTSLISPAAFEEAYDAAAEAGETVIAILLSSKLSGTYQSGVLAAEGRDNVFVVDSLGATIGQRILVEYALRLVEQGKSAKEIIDEIEKAKYRVRLMGVPDTLEYLHKGGRISRTVAIVGGALAIKPVLALVEGVVLMIGKARGSKNVDNYLIQEIKKANGVDFSMPYCLGYTGLSDAALKRYIEDSREIWQEHTDSLPICTVGATIGTHLGPNAIAVAFFGND